MKIICKIQEVKLYVKFRHPNKFNHMAYSIKLYFFIKKKVIILIIDISFMLRYIFKN